MSSENVSMPAGAAPVGETLRFGESVRFAFNNPLWPQNLLIGALCVFSTNVIPIVGQLIWMGYVFEIIEKLHREPKASYPDFSFDRFADYLMRGLWLFLVGLVLMAVIVPVFVISVLAALSCSGAAAYLADETAAIVAAAILIVFAACLCYITAMILGGPFLLRAGLTQDVGLSLNVDFAKDFLQKMWKEMLLAGLFAIAVTLVAQLVGFAVLCIGIFPAMAWTGMVHGHLLWQLYEIYLGRGGQPIPLKAPANSTARPATSEPI